MRLICWLYKHNPLRIIFITFTHSIWLLTLVVRQWTCEKSTYSVELGLAHVVFPEMLWSFIQQPANLSVKRGEHVTVTCRPPYSRPAAQVSWFKNNQLLTPTAHQTVLPSGDLFFHRFVCMYACLKTCFVGDIISLMGIKLIIYIYISVSWLYSLQCAGVRQWELLLQGLQHPPAKIYHFQKSHSDRAGYDITIIDPQDCSTGHSSRRRFIYYTSCFLLFFPVAPPSVRLWPQVSTVSVGARVVLECQVSGNPSPTISWMKRGHSKQTGGKIVVGYDDMLWLLEGKDGWWVFSVF